MEQRKPILKITLAELNALAETIIKHREVILVQRDPKDKKMDDRSLLIHKLWMRVGEKSQCRVGAYPNIKEHSTHEQVLVGKLKELLDKVLDTPLADEDYNNFLANLLQRALNS
ncbi:MAG: hypothetical protein WAQ98_07220 [Blastocatellia bacterium]